MIRRELLVAFVFVLLALFAFAPPLLVALGSYPGGTLEKIEAFILERQELLIALGTLFLVVGLSVWTSHLSNRSAEKRDAANRMLQAELKVADFRQAWINELRDEIEEFCQITFSPPDERDHNRHTALIGKIHMRLNLSETPARELYQALLESARHDHSDTNSEVEALLAVTKKANAFLRGEWARMKMDIQKALTFKVEEP
ncbi:hypothetical protein [Rhodobacter sp. SY28-1]|uniref:hypothetical protein n=1 Tax=Rhodobacter sp. SY28-1 TaxID=2562317 RepID=UPI0010C03D0C|nr:hypothetical protein [Rhodobacter sp. SY28-1]